MTFQVKRSLRPKLRTIKTGLELEEESQKSPSKISFQVPSIDNLLRGGIRLKGLTEISGEAGSGKTQLAIHLCLTAQFPVEMGGMHKKVLYIYTEGALTTERVIEMGRNMIQKHRLNVTTTELLEKFIYISVFDYEALLQLLEGRIQRLLDMEPIGLIVIDSVAAVFRLHANYINRSYNMATLVTILESLAKKHNFALVCINQVSNNLQSEDSAPALGLAWARLVSTRLQIYKEKSQVMDQSGIKMQKRTLKVVWAPNIPLGKATFFIGSQGIS